MKSDSCFSRTHCRSRDPWSLSLCFTSFGGRASPRSSGTGGHERPGTLVKARSLSSSGFFPKGWLSRSCEGQSLCEGFSFWKWPAWHGRNSHGCTGSRADRRVSVCVCARTYVFELLWGTWGASLGAQLVKNLPAMQETLVQFLGQKIPWRRKQPPTPVFLDFPGVSAGEESTRNEGDLDSIPVLGRSPREGNNYPSSILAESLLHWQGKCSAGVPSGRCWRADGWNSLCSLLLGGKETCIIVDSGEDSHHWCSVRRCGSLTDNISVFQSQGISVDEQ